MCFVFVFLFVCLFTRFARAAFREQAKGSAAARAALAVFTCVAHAAQRCGNAVAAANLNQTNVKIKFPALTLTKQM